VSDPAHVVHKAVLQELLSIYHLFGDPALTIR
jgi:hypothetical protein